MSKVRSNNDHDSDESSSDDQNEVPRTPVKRIASRQGSRRNSWVLSSIDRQKNAVKKRSTERPLQDPHARRSASKSRQEEHNNKLDDNSDRKTVAKHSRSKSKHNKEEYPPEAAAQNRSLQKQVAAERIGGDGVRFKTSPDVAIILNHLFWSFSPSPKAHHFEQLHAILQEAQERNCISDGANIDIPTLKAWFRNKRFSTKKSAQQRFSPGIKAEFLKLYDDLASQFRTYNLIDHLGVKT